MSTHPENRWIELRDSLLKEVAGPAPVIVRIPKWQPVGLEEGLRWVQSMIYEGFYIAYKISRSDSFVTVWIKRWEYGEDEPAWTIAKEA
jgi:hypothetical protein